MSAFFVLLALGAFAWCQDAQIYGRIVDQSGAVIQKAAVQLVNVDTGVTISTLTNDAGQYVVAGLTPSHYKVSVQASGFNPAMSDVISLNVAQNASLDFTLKPGTAVVSVEVNPGDVGINTSDASVSTVVDRKYVEEIPLNGRSFQTLILLAPGVVTSSPQGSDDGSFSVNGMRTDANYFTVDGASVNNGAGTLSGVGNAGMSYSSTSLGTTQAMLPVDALQEFRVSTSSFSAEFGRQPGAQVTMQSRSGTNFFHGDTYDYLRNTIFDANNWFNNYSTPIIPRSTEQMNDFGGAFGGPLTIPHLFAGKDRAFFFAAYEGLRLNQPVGATVYYVPSNGTYNVAPTYGTASEKNVRANSPAALQGVLAAFPLPNCTTVAGVAPEANAACVDHGDGFSPFLFSGTAPSQVNAYFLRADFQVTPKLRVFARYSDSPSTSNSLFSTGPDETVTAERMRIFMLGADSILRGTLTNELRLQYSPSQDILSYIPTTQGGAVPFNMRAAESITGVGGYQLFLVEDNTIGGVEGEYLQAHYGTRQFQPNVVDSVIWSYRSHLFKAGVDYRQTTTYLADGNISRDPTVEYEYEQANNILINSPQEVQLIQALRQDPTTKNLGLYFMDTWRVKPRVTLDLGLRWDFNPPPSISGAQQYTYTGNVLNPSTLALSTLGAPIYKTQYNEFQPRVGVAWTLHTDPGHELVLRAGGGLFYDTVAMDSSIGSGAGLGASYKQLLGVSEAGKVNVPFPATPAEIFAPFPAIASTGITLDDVADPNLTEPSTIQWNVTLEQGLGAHQSFTLGYVGSVGRNLIQYSEYDPASTIITALLQYQNGPGSNYNALQAGFIRHVANGLQLTAHYTWSHALDANSSDDGNLPVLYGNSNHDVRNNFSASLIYNIPGAHGNPLLKYVSNGWNLAIVEIARSAFPVNPVGADVHDPIDGGYYPGRLNYNGGNPYVYKPGIPGGRQFNPAVFSVPATGYATMGTAPRNFLRGFGENTADVAIDRNFALYENLHLEFRGEAFNILNHPNFGALNITCGTTTAGAACNNTLMGQATNMLSSALTGAASIFQQGGPRSLQFAMKITF